ncbi:MAG: hypothetical protein ACM3NS_08110, partial [Deltaproteobacteria bacterium]
QHQGLVVLILLLAVLMVSNVKYPRFPAIGVRSVRGIAGLLFHLAVLAGGLLAPEHFLFPLGLVYMLFGAGRALILGLMERTETDVATMHASAGEGEIPPEPSPGRERRPWTGRRRKEPSA